MKKFVWILVVTNLITAVLFFHARGQWDIANNEIKTWKEREGRRVEHLEALLPFYLVDHAHSVDLTKLLDRAGIGHFHKDGVLVSGMLEIGLDDRGLAKSVTVLKYEDKRL